MSYVSQLKVGRKSRKLQKFENFNKLNNKKSNSCKMKNIFS